MKTFLLSTTTVITESSSTNSIIFAVIMLLIFFIFMKFVVNRHAKISKKVKQNEEVVHCGCHHFNGECRHCDK